jgi:hypothetical protein
VAAAGNEAKRLEGDLEALHRQRRAYIAQLRIMIERQLAELEASESSAGEPLPERRAPEPEPASTTPAWLDSLVKE